MFAGLESESMVLAKMAYALVLGGAIGLEREIKDRPAGFRTHMLVAAAAAMLTGLGDMALALNEHQADQRVNIDPFRLLEAVIAGVAFIGAGTIFAHRGAPVVVGITTAASLLMVAVIGVAAGFGYFWLAGLATALTLAILTVLSRVDGWMGRGRDGPKETGKGPHEGA
jgi:putative Mg2+ transporter-C (MgtC) family protein